MVPEQKGEVEARHGGTEERRGKCEAADCAQEFPRERAGPGDFEEKGYCERGGLSEELGGHVGEAMYISFQCCVDSYLTLLSSTKKTV